MNPTDDDPDDVMEAYRKASAEKAGRPTAGMRRAILEEAAAASNRRRPAANDSSYRWRGIAVVAVLSIGIVLWRQVDHRIPGATPVVVAQQMREEAKAEAAPETQADASADLAATAAPAAPAAPVAQMAPVAPAQQPVTPPPPPAADVQLAEAESRVAAAADAVLAQSAAPSPSPAPFAASRAAAVQGAANAERASAKQAPRAEDAAEAEALLRLNFPTQYASAQPHNVWLVVDGAGKVLRSGELSTGQTLGALRTDIERELGGGRLLRPWRIHTLRNAQGQQIELAVAQTP